MKRFFLCFVCATLLLCGCTSLQEQADELLQQGSYSEALSAYDQVLQNNPKNYKARAGQRRARLGWINRKLIEVRKLRLANNQTESVEVLLDVFENQKVWKLNPIGNVAFTQKEESHWASVSVTQLIESSLRERKPLRAQYLLSRYQVFFQNKEASVAAKHLQVKTRLLATNNCRSASKALKKNQYFYGQFVERFCQHWNLPPPDLSRLQKNFKSETYSRVSVNSDTAQGFPKTFNLDLENRLQNRLQDSPWYEPSSERILNLQFIGDYKYEHSSEDTVLTHSYTESVPYEVSRIETKNSDNKKRDSGLVTGIKIAGMILAAIAGDFGSERREDNGDGTVTVYETHYRDEVRTANYPATAHLERFQTRMALQGRVNRWPLQVVRNEEDTHNSVSHTNTMTGIGLFPRKVQLEGPDTWVQNQRQELSIQFERNLKEIWQDRYCRSRRFNGQSSWQIERAFRCIQVPNAPTPVGFARWFKSQYGLELTTAINQLYPKPPETI